MQEEPHPPKCNLCSFPLCHSYLPNNDEILYIGDLDVFCGNCGTNFSVKNVCDIQSKFSSIKEKEMSKYLADIVYDHTHEQHRAISRLTYKYCKKKMISRFGIGSWWKYKHTISRDLEHHTWSSNNDEEDQQSAPRPIFTVATSFVKPRLSSFVEVLSPTKKDITEKNLEKETGIALFFKMFGRKAS